MTGFNSSTCSDFCPAWQPVQPGLRMVAPGTKKTRHHHGGLSSPLQRWCCHPAPFFMNLLHCRIIQSRILKVPTSAVISQLGRCFSTSRLRHARHRQNSAEEKADDIATCHCGGGRMRNDSHARNSSSRAHRELQLDLTLPIELIFVKESLSFDSV